MTGQNRHTYLRENRLSAFRDLRQDMLFAMRLSVRERAFTLTIVMVLALGIAVTSTFFTLMNGIVLRGLPLDDVDKIVDVSSRDGQGRVRRMSFADYEDVRVASRSF